MHFNEAKHAYCGHSMLRFVSLATVFVIWPSKLSELENSDQFEGKASICRPSYIWRQSKIQEVQDRKGMELLRLFYGIQSPSFFTHCCFGEFKTCYALFDYANDTAALSSSAHCDRCNEDAWSPLFAFCLLSDSQFVKIF